MKREKREKIALKILCALLSNPERYKYISAKVSSGILSQEEANQKNVDKAYMIADTFINTPV